MADSRFFRWSAVWRRNALVWRKSAKTALLGGFAEPLFYLLALGYGLGHFIGEIEGVSYIGFLTAGILSTSSMNAATFEGLYMAYTRMTVLRTWDGMLAAPLSIVDVVLGEVVWLGTKSVISASLILLVATAFGLTASWTALWVIPVAFLTGLCFGSMALLVTSYARSYDFFVYYITLLITPMVLLSGVFFPLEALPEPVRIGVGLLPLHHVVEIIRPLVAGLWDWDLLPHLLVPAGFAVVSACLAIWRLKCRLLE
ncbi:ABC transporter permease [Methylococcus sp. EFPC2]|uniref:ABC transporter permease n=1 Tax=Methylococcus sp. EFPC2 TaxID=2812648 RepID=UPI0019672CB8|nr:ABC transporter permease [Methylococcus sp. EFPC2]QSA98335.1 ABC transporter permease [Methylococcus sp. EFPC2]